MFSREKIKFKIFISGFPLAKWVKYIHFVTSIMGEMDISSNALSFIVQASHVHHHSSVVTEARELLLAEAQIGWEAYQFGKWTPKKHPKKTKGWNLKKVVSKSQSRIHGTNGIFTYMNGCFF